MSLLTWCHRTPAETPTRVCIPAIRVEEDLHSVAPGRYDWRQEVAAAVVHQGCSVPICDLHKVAWAGGDITTRLDSKAGEIQPQYLPTLHFYGIYLVKVFRIVSGVVW